MMMTLQAMMMNVVVATAGFQQIEAKEIDEGILYCSEIVIDAHSARGW